VFGKIVVYFKFGVCEIAKILKSELSGLKIVPSEFLSKLRSIVMFVDVASTDPGSA